MADGMGPGVGYLYHSQEDWDEWGAAIARLVKGEGTLKDARLVDKRVQDDLVWAGRPGFQYKVNLTLCENGVKLEDVRKAMLSVCNILEANGEE